MGVSIWILADQPSFLKVLNLTDDIIGGFDVSSHISIWLKYNCYVMIAYLTADPSVSKCHNCITSIINIGYHYHIFWLLRSLQRKSMFISYGLYLHDNTKFR